ncbi:MAG TPA: hypothetical protein VI895_11790 [Bdellovibrionota bacterium]|nr:hypothetical protein [Bdellovibrionota bacterium]
MKCPIAGDPLYGRPDEHYLEIVRGQRIPERMQLHAWSLEGSVGDKTIHIESPLPDLFR